jgi:16S rRNA (guanine527-N7)-methyltransferase
MSDILQLRAQFEKQSPLMLKLGVDQQSLALVLKYIELLWASNQELNLISRKMTTAELIDNHLIDCLLALPELKKVMQAHAENSNTISSIGDFGSGGGLPGVLYALLFPQITFHLFEKSHLKQDFLNRCQTLAKNIRVHGDVPIKLKEVDLVIARAFKPLEAILEMSRGYYVQGGKYFLLKGRKEKIDEEVLLSQKKFKDLQVKIQALQSPILDVERHLVQIHL